jgi:hypothetical protein
MGAQRQILELLKEATSITTGGPTPLRFQISLSWVDYAVKWSDPSAIDAYRAALGLLEVLLADRSSLESRHSRLLSLDAPNIRHLAVDGAACALSSGQIEVALQLLEQGRSVLLTQAAKHRTSVDDLEAVNSTLAGEFKSICMKMDMSIMGFSPPHIEASSIPATEDVIAKYVTENLVNVRLTIKFAGIKNCWKTGWMSSPGFVPSKVLNHSWSQCPSLFFKHLRRKVRLSFSTSAQGVQMQSLFGKMGHPDRWLSAAQNQMLLRIWRRRLMLRPQTRTSKSS